MGWDSGGVDFVGQLTWEGLIVDILPRPKNNQFAFTSSHLLSGRTVDLLLSRIIDDMQTITTADYTSLRRVAFNLAASKRLGWPCVTLFHNTVTKTDLRIINYLKNASIVTVSDPEPGKARVMMCNDLEAITNDYTSNPLLKPRGFVYIKRSGERKNITYGQKDLDKINLANTGMDVTYQPTWSDARIRLSNEAVTYDRLYINNLSTYGRFLASFQSLSKIDRATIRINGIETHECDFTAMHPMLLYAISNQTPPNDIYHVLGLPSTYRPYIKLGLLITINAKNYEAALLALRERVPVGVDPVKILKGLQLTHQKISKFFWSNAGIHLMNIESQIAEYVLLACADNGVRVLCMHDGFICMKRDVSAVQRWMAQGFKEVTECREVRCGWV